MNNPIICKSCGEEAEERHDCWPAVAERTSPSHAIRWLVDKQAEDEGLWFIAQSCSEAYLQQELRKLHAAIEATIPFLGRAE